MKHLTRTKMRRARRALSTAQQLEAAVGLWYQFRCSPLFFNSKRIGLYLANDAEIDPAILGSYLEAGGRDLALPCLDPLGVNRLQFAPYHSNSALAANRYGIDEPAGHHRIKSISLDLVLVPLVAFDDAGNRLGMGAGFYDRTFAFKKYAPGLGPKLVGLAHECQKTKDLQPENWDIALDAVLTEQRYIDLTGR